jgi:hypothetical protein
MASLHIRPAHVYRGLYREVRRVQAVGQGTAPDFAGMLRQGFSRPSQDTHGETSATQVKQLHDASEILLFLRSQRVYTVHEHCYMLKGR